MNKEVIEIQKIKKIKSRMLIGLSLAIICIMYATLLLVHYSSLHDDSNEKIKHLKKFSNDIIYYDEVLTMSSRMYAFTGDPSWRLRYDEFAGLLDAALVRANDSDPVIAKAIQNTISVNNRLVNLEMKSFDLVQAGHNEMAINTLMNDEYEILKKVYQTEIQKSIQQLELKEKALISKHQEYEDYFTLIIVVLALLFLVSWLYLLNYLRETDALIRNLVVVDKTTGLFNRRAFDETLNCEIQRSNREGRELMLAIADVDNFKLYNDTYGHPMGDDALRQVGRVFAECCRRTTESAFRIGGEEFALIANIENKEEGIKLVGLLIKQIESLGIKHKNNPPHDLLTISMGVTFLSDSKEKTYESLYRQADIALYQAKESGKNDFSEFQPVSDF